jgi:predicted nicotinamide N-methyase
MYLCEDIIGNEEIMKEIDVCVAGDVLYDDELARNVFPWFQKMANNNIEVINKMYSYIDTLNILL